ncbi:MAG TPA: YggT family protein [Steroidobacteraceae bacterium]|jgi:YggT family protein|nr:YggT family protein [Steroidobacteraceae bacterium]
MNALYFLVDSVLTLALYVALLRLLMQWSRADFRNPIAQAVVKITNPLIMPLRRVLPPINKIDTASVVTVLIVTLADVVLMSMVRGFGVPPPVLLLRAAALLLATSVLWLYFYAIFLYALMSLIAQGSYSPMQPLLTSLCEPILQPIRRIIPPIAGLDLSPLWAGLLIQALLILLR